MWNEILNFLNNNIIAPILLGLVAIILKIVERIIFKDDKNTNEIRNIQL